MKSTLCILCGRPVPPIKRPWYWRLWHVEGMPRHAQNDSVCYEEFQRRIGIENPSPLPKDK